MQISVKYRGKAVDAGMMSATDVFGAIQGFSNAYSKISLKEAAAQQDELKVVAFRKGSFSFVLKVVRYYSENKDAIDGMVADAQQLADAAKKFSDAGFEAIGTIFGVINIYKHLKDKQPQDVTIDGGNNTISVTNIEGKKASFPKEVYDAYKENTLKNDLEKITAPLSKGKVNVVGITSKSSKGKTKTASITHKDKYLFSVKNIVIASEEEVQLVGTLISLSKETKRGLFESNDNKRIYYHLAGKNPEQMFDHFLYRGAVRVSGIASIDESGQIQSIEISDIVDMQPRLL